MAMYVNVRENGYSDGIGRVKMAKVWALIIESELRQPGILSRKSMFHLHS